MHYDSVQVRAKALKDAEAALVQKRHGPPASMTEVETVVDAVLASIEGVLITGDDIPLAAEAVRTSVGWDRFDGEPERRRLLAERLEGTR